MNGRTMPQYDYRCPECGDNFIEITSIERYTASREFPLECPSCPSHPDLKRVFSFAHHPGMESHFNLTTNSVISSSRQFSEELKRSSDEASISSGIPHNYVPVDPRDLAHHVDQRVIEQRKRELVDSGVTDRKLYSV